jgi:hypothetical protein
LEVFREVVVLAMAPALDVNAAAQTDAARAAPLPHGR